MASTATVKYDEMSVLPEVRVVSPVNGEDDENSPMFLKVSQHPDDQDFDCVTAVPASEATAHQSDDNLDIPHNNDASSIDGKEVLLSSSPLSGDLKPSKENFLATPWTFWFDKRFPSSTSNTSTKKKNNNTEAKRGRVDSADYASQLRELYTFGSVEGFYKLFVFLKKPSQLPTNVNISLFRSGFRPMWEDFAGTGGGMWIARVKKTLKVFGANNKLTKGECSNHYEDTFENVETGSSIKMNVDGCGSEVTATASKRRRKRRSAKISKSDDEVYFCDVFWEQLVMSCIGEILTNGFLDVIGIVLSIRPKDIVFSVWNSHGTSYLMIGYRLRELLMKTGQAASVSLRYKNFEESLKDGSSYRNARLYVFKDDVMGSKAKDQPFKVPT